MFRIWEQTIKYLPREKPNGKRYEYYKKKWERKIKNKILELYLSEVLDDKNREEDKKKDDYPL